MSYWPFVTIFVSLILILFFRRLDKRTINFNKFKKYAEKLSEDFNLFLGKKREELKSQMGELERVVARAEALLDSIESSRDNLGKTSVQLQSERIELEGVKRELEKLKGLKQEVSEEVSTLRKSLPSLKPLSKQVDKITIDIAENEKALKSILLAGDPIVNFDNVNVSIFGEALEAIITEPIYKMRLLGSNDVVSMSNQHSLW